MGADLIITYTELPVNTDGCPVNFTTYDRETHETSLTAEGRAAFAEIARRINALTDDEALGALENAGLEGWQITDGDPDDDPETDPELAVKIRERLTKLVDPETGYLTSWNRDTTTFTVKGHPILLTGGMSWGDTPSDSYDDVSLLGASGILDFTLSAEARIDAHDGGQA